MNSRFQNIRFPGLRMVVLLLLVLAPIGTLLAQDGGDQGALLRTKDGYLLVNNEEGAWFTVRLIGDSLSPLEIDGAFMLDEQFVQVLSQPYSQEDYHNGMSTEKEIELLESRRDYEVEYLEEEVFKQSVRVVSEVFLNRSGKRFLLWYVWMPKDFQTDVEMDEESRAKAQVFLTFVANSQLVTLSLPLIGTGGMDPHLVKLKDIAEEVNVFGAPVSLGALSLRLELEAKGEPLIYADDESGFQIEIPEWLNLPEPPQEFDLMGSLDDVDNIKNVIGMLTFSKRMFKDLDEMVESIAAPEKSTANGFTYSKRKKMKPKSHLGGYRFRAKASTDVVVYYNEYVFFEAPGAYVWIMFTSTENTYGRNKDLFEAFLDLVRIRVPAEEGGHPAHDHDHDHSHED